MTAIEMKTALILRNRLLARWATASDWVLGLTDREGYACFIHYVGRKLCGCNGPIEQLSYSIASAAYSALLGIRGRSSALAFLNRKIWERKHGWTSRFVVTLRVSFRLLQRRRRRQSLRDVLIAQPAS